MYKNLFKLCKEFNIKTYKYEGRSYVRWQEIKGKYHVPLKVEKDMSRYLKQVPFGNISVEIDDEDILSIETALPVSRIEKLVEKCHAHPEHLNGLNIVYPDNDFIKKFKKQKEIEILSSIYKKYRNQYKLTYQFPLLNYKIDLCFEALPGSPEDNVSSTNKNFGIAIDLAIEVDENDHRSYKSDNELLRQEIITSLDYSLIRINPDENKDIFAQIDACIKEQRTKRLTGIDIEEVENKLKTRNVSADFFNMIKPNLLKTDNQFKIRMEDIMEYLGYKYKENFVKHIVKPYLIEGVNYRIYNEKEVQNLLSSSLLSDLLSPPLKQRGGNNKQFIYLSMRGFYEVCLNCNKPKAREIKSWFIDVYEICFEVVLKAKENLLTYTKNQNESKKKLVVLLENKNKVKVEELASKNKLDKSKFKNELKNKDLLIKQQQAQIQSLEQELKKLRQKEEKTKKVLKELLEE